MEINNIYKVSFENRYEVYFGFLRNEKKFKKFYNKLELKYLTNNTYTMNFKLFFTGFLQVFFVAINTYFIFKEFYIGVFLCGWTISLIWSWNVKKVVFGSFRDRMYYSFGAGVGSLVGLIVSKFFFNLL